MCLTCLTTISESPKTLSNLTSRQITLYIPCTNASYYAILFVHLNSNLQVSIVFKPSGLINMKPTPAPSLYFDPSKYNVQNKFLTNGLSTRFIYLEELVWEKFSMWEVIELSKNATSMHWIFLKMTQQSSFQWYYC